MSGPTIHGKRPIYSASNAVQTVAGALRQIKHEDGLTWADMGAVLGKSEDQAAKYADGTAEMSISTFGRGYREWNGRFGGDFLRLCEGSRAGCICDQDSLTSLLEAATKISEALSDDGEVSAEEVRANRGALERARDAIDAQLAKLVAAA